MKKIGVVVAVFVVLLFTAGVAVAAHHDRNVKIATDAKLGKFLTDGGGKTLYWFKKDSAGKSACEGDCVKNWPLFYSDKIVPDEGCEAAAFGTITRADGAKQTTYKGYPLYYFKGDAKAGDTAGQGVKDVWFVVPPDKKFGN